MALGKNRKRRKKWSGDDTRIKLGSTWTNIGKQLKWTLEYMYEAEEDTYADGTTDLIESKQKGVLKIEGAQTSIEELGLLDQLIALGTVEVALLGHSNIDGKVQYFYIPAAAPSGGWSLESGNRKTDLVLSCSPQPDVFETTTEQMPADFVVADTTSTNRFFNMMETAIA